MILTKIQVNRTGSGEEAKIEFQDGRHGGHLGFPIKPVLAILIYQSTIGFLPSFQSTGLSFQKKKRKEDGGYLGYPIRTFFFIYF